MFARPPATADALNRALDAITDKFGARAVTTADVADAAADDER
jgi:hypothetical protein